LMMLPRPGRRHPGADHLAAQHHPGQVHIDDVVPIFLRIGLEGTVLVSLAIGLGIDAGIVDQDMRHAPIGHQRVGRRLQRCLVRNAGFIDPDAILPPRKQFCQLVRAHRPAAINCHLRTGIGQRTRKFAAQLSQPAGYDRNLSFDTKQVSQTLPPPLMT
jgi:hypothetical protein